MEQDAIRDTVRRLARPHVSGGSVIERSVVIAEGAGSAEIMDWISAHDGVGDSSAAVQRGQGLHGARISPPAAATAGLARRWVLPAGALD